MINKVNSNKNGSIIHAIAYISQVVCNISTSAASNSCQSNTYTPLQPAEKRSIVIIVVMEGRILWRLHTTGISLNVGTKDLYKGEISQLAQAISSIHWSKIWHLISPQIPYVNPPEHPWNELESSSGTEEHQPINLKQSCKKLMSAWLALIPRDCRSALGPCHKVWQLFQSWATSMK